MALTIHGSIHRPSKATVGGLIIAVALILTGCQSNAGSKSNSATSSSHSAKTATKHSSKSSSTKTDVATTVLKDYTAKLPEDSSTRSNNGEVTYSQFSTKNGSWSWQLTSKKRGVIADGTVLSATQGHDSSILQMKSSGGTKYTLTVQPATGGYSVKTDYQQISGLYTSSTDGSSTTSTKTSASWTSGVPSALVGTWSTDYYPSSSGDAGGDAKVKTKRTRFFIDTDRLDFNTVYATKKHTILIEGPGAGSLRKVEYQKLADNQYQLKDSSASKAYQVTLSGSQLKVSGYPTMKKVSSKAGLSEGFGDGRAKNLTETQIDNWISRHADDLADRPIKKLMFEPGAKNKQGEYVVHVREDDPDSPVYATVGYYKIDADGILQYSISNGSDANWQAVSDDPND